MRKKRRKLSAAGKIIVIFAVAMAAIGIYAYTHRETPIDKLDKTAVQELDADKVRENVTTKYDESDTYELSDYVVSGETLTLYQKAYVPGESDDTLGKNAVLKNVETGDETSFTFSGGADLGIQTGQLDPGVYEIYIYDQYKKKRAWFDEELTSETLTDMRRNKSVNEVILDADKDLLADYGITTDRNYAYLVVTEQAPRVKMADVIIDPGGNVYNELDYSTETLTADGANENDLANELAGLVGQELEKAGLRVALTRDADEAVSYYGEDGRAGKAYESGAKVFLNLSMTNEENVARPYFLVSPFLEGTLASRIAYDMRNAGLELADFSYNNAPDAGVAYDARQQNEDLSYSSYSFTPSIRETGGKATYAGHSTAISGNQPYQQVYGPVSMNFYFANATSPDSITYYQANKEAIAKELAQGIIDYYQIGKEGDDEAADQ